VAALHQLPQAPPHSHKQPRQGVSPPSTPLTRATCLPTSLALCAWRQWGLSRDVFTCTLRCGTLCRFVKHCGRNIRDIEICPLTLDHPWCALGDLSKPVVLWFSAVATTPLLLKRRRYFPPQEQGTARFRQQLTRSFATRPEPTGWCRARHSASTRRTATFCATCSSWFQQMEVFRLKCLAKHGCYAHVSGLQVFNALPLPLHANTEEGRMYTVEYTHTLAIPPKTTEVTFFCPFLSLVGVSTAVRVRRGRCYSGQTCTSTCVA